MTPTEDYAQKRQQAETLVRHHAPAHLHDELIALLRPAIALTAMPADDTQIPIGASKFGGAPDVPEGFEWPMWDGKPLGFLAQINLEEVAPYDVETLLPDQGILLFFQRYRGGFFSVDSKTYVQYVEGESVRPSLPPSKFDPKEAWQIPPCRITPSARWTLTDWGASELFETSTAKEWEAIGDLLDNIAPSIEHQLLGYAKSVQGSVEIDAQIQATQIAYSQTPEQTEQGALQWLPLLQIDSQFDMDSNPQWTFGDMGVIQFMIRRADLLARNWNETQFTFQCS